VWYITDQGRQSIVQLLLEGQDVLGTGFSIQAAEDSSGKLVISEVMSSASDVLRSLMNTGLNYPHLCFVLSQKQVDENAKETMSITYLVDFRSVVDMFTDGMGSSYIFVCVLFCRSHDEMELIHFYSQLCVHCCSCRGKFKLTNG